MKACSVKQRFPMTYGVQHGNLSSIQIIKTEPHKTI